jgi:hypothetical protein
MKEDTASGGVIHGENYHTGYVLHRFLTAFVQGC